MWQAYSVSVRRFLSLATRVIYSPPGHTVNRYDAKGQFSGRAHTSRYSLVDLGLEAAISLPSVVLD
jgi:hypothetical protein